MTDTSAIIIPAGETPPPLSDAARVLHRWCLKECVPDPVIKAPTLLQCEAAVQRFGRQAPDVMFDFEQKRRKQIRDRSRDPLNCGYVPDIWQRTEQMLWAALTLLVLFGANRSSKTWFCVWAAIRHMVTNPKACVLFLHNDETASVQVHQKIFHHYLPLEYRPKGGKRTRTAESYISYQPGTGFSNGVVVFPNGAQAHFGNYKQEWDRFEGEAYTLINASERIPLALLETLGFRLPGQGAKLTMLWDYTPIHGITPTIERVVKGARCIEHERSPHLPADHKAQEGQDWPRGHMPRLQEGATEGTRIFYFFSEDNALGAGEALRDKMRREKWDVLTIERRMHGFARNVTGRALPKFSKVNIVPLAKLKGKGGILEESLTSPTGPTSPTTVAVARPNRHVCRRMIFDPAGARNPFISWFAGDGHGRHALYREWPPRQTHGEWATPSSDETKWNGDKGPAQEKEGLSVVQLKKLILEAEGWVWDASRPKGECCWIHGPAGIEEIYERYMDPRAGAAQMITEREEQGETLIEIFEDEQLDHDGNVVGPSMTFIPATGYQEDHGIDVINTKYLGYDNSRDLVPLLNEPLFYVAEECEQTIYACFNYRPGRGKKDEACKDPFDNVRMYFASDPEYVPPGGFEGRGFRRPHR